MRISTSKRILLALALGLAGCSATPPAEPPDAQRKPAEASSKGSAAGVAAARSPAAGATAGLKPPVARKEPKVDRLHGFERVDDYFWLRKKDSPEVLDHLKAESAYTDAVMKPTEPLQNALYQEMLARIKETDIGVPYKEGDWFYYTRTEQGKRW